MNVSITAEDKKQNRRKPPLSIERIVGEILAGAVLCMIALIFVWRISILRFGIGPYTGSVGQLAGIGVLLMYIVIFLPLYVLGSAVGVYLIGNLGKQTGSLLSTLGGGILGMIVMVLLLFSSSNGDKSIAIGEKIFVWAVLSIVGPSFAALGFNLTRRYKGTSATLTWFPHRKDEAKATNESIITEKNIQVRQRPPLSLGRIIGQILAGMGMVFVVLLLFKCVKIVVFPLVDVATRIALKTTLSIIASLVYGISSAIAVYLGGSRDRQTGSFPLTLAFGFLPGLLKLVMFISHSDEVLIILPWLYWPVVLFIVPIMATLCFNLTRRYKELPSS